MAFLRVRTSFVGRQGSPWLSTLNFVSDGATDAQTAASAVEGFWDDIAGVIAGTTTWSVDSTVDELDTTTGELLYQWPVTTTPAGGSAESDELPFTTQGLMRLSTGTIIGGRPLKGRMFIPAPCESANTNGRPTSAYLLTLNNSAADHLLASTVPLGVYSKTHRQLGEVSGARAWTDWAELRSRRN